VSDSSTISKLGRYELRHVLGRGAMGEVFEGFDPFLNRRVAVKTILRSALSADSVADASARFVREAQAIARLNHQHIITIYDFGEHGDIAYLVMEFIRGRDLKAHLSSERLDLGEAVRIVSELLAALDFAHQHGVVHRDVKPANVMLDLNRRVKLTDFGVARLADGAAERTRVGTVVGTPSYMSPEQTQGFAVGSRSDLFAAGIILYECLTGSKPFAGPNIWTVQRQPSVTNPEVDPRFDSVVARALAKDPADRYATAADFAVDLEAAFKAVRGAKPSVQMQATPTARGAAVIAAEAGEFAEPIVPAVSPEPTDGSPATAVSPTVEPSAGARSDTGRRLWLTRGLVALLIASGAWFILSSRSPAPLSSAPTAMRVPSPSLILPTREMTGTAAPVSTRMSPRSTVMGVSTTPAVSAGLAKAANKANKRKEKLRTPDTNPTKAVEARAQPAVGGVNKNPRCEDLLQRFQLGDELSADDLLALKTKCRQ
jgi:serine/threonine protein kinase